MSRRLAVFRCDASPAIGSGHVFRCLTLADALREAGWECCFLSTGETSQTVSALADSGYQVTSPDQPPSRADLLVVDHYGLDRDYETSCRTWAKKILVIDDLADRPHDCDILMDQTYGRDANDYNSLVPPYCLVLTGPQYALLRPQFATMRDEALRLRKKRGGQVDRVLVSLGGTNLHNITSLALEALDAFNSKPLDIDVVLGKNAPFTESVYEWCERIQARGFHRLIWHDRVENMAELMAQADMSIGAGGTTSWERCCLGLPTLLVVLADNQKKVAGGLADGGAVINMGDIQSLNASRIRNKLGQLVSRHEKVERLSEQAKKICDGRGVFRLAQNLIYSLTLRPASIEDAELLLAWRNDTQTRAYSRNSEEISLDQHISWLKNKISSKEDFVYIAEVEKQPVGVVRADKSDHEFYELSWTTAPSFRGNGYAKAMVKNFVSMLAKPVKACIQPGNVASIKVAEAAGLEIDSASESDGFWVFKKGN